MAEYIERETVLAALKEGASFETVDALVEFSLIVKDIPAADVEPRKHWVSVTDRLPDGNDCDGVLVVVNGRYKNVHFDRALQLAGYDAYERAWILDAYPEWDAPEVTHWMPLPEVPGL